MGILPLAYQTPTYCYLKLYKHPTAPIDMNTRLCHKGGPPVQYEFGPLNPPPLLAFGPVVAQKTFEGWPTLAHGPKNVAFGPVWVIFFNHKRTISAILGHIFLAHWANFWPTLAHFGPPKPPGPYLLAHLFML